MDKTSMHPLNVLTHFDGRNRQKLADLRDYFSELAWMKYRVRIMLEYLKFLLQKKLIRVKKNAMVDSSLALRMTIVDGERVQEIEQTTNHDLRALELWLKEKLDKQGFKSISNYINVGFGSEDVNNIALRMQIRDAFSKVLIPGLKIALTSLRDLTEKSISQPLLARTHGQPASVTTLGKELAVFLDQINREMEVLLQIKFYPKFSGEVGSFTSVTPFFSEKNWLVLERDFLKQLGFNDAATATQIPPYLDLIQFFDSLRRLNQIFIGLCKDVWLYASFGYFTLTAPITEAGSAGMPHKVNPQYFEGAEGGLELANSLCEFFSRKLSYNRLQRDFSDSTVRRNIVLVFAYSLLSYQSIAKGLSRLSINKKKIDVDLNDHYEIFSEVLKTALILEGRENAYDLVRGQMRKPGLPQIDWEEIVIKMKLSNELRTKLLNLRYSQLTKFAVSKTREVLAKTNKQLKNQI